MFLFFVMIKTKCKKNISENFSLLTGRLGSSGRLLSLSRMFESLPLKFALLVDDLDVLPLAELPELGVGQQLVDQSFLSIFFRDSVGVKVDGRVHNVTDLNKRRKKFNNFVFQFCHHCSNNDFFFRKSSNYSGLLKLHIKISFFFSTSYFLNTKIDIERVLEDFNFIILFTIQRRKGNIIVAQL